MYSYLCVPDEGHIYITDLATVGLETFGLEVSTFMLAKIYFARPS